jgi:8-oxo-dGTP diphosphatase
MSGRILDQLCYKDKQYCMWGRGKTEGDLEFKGLLKVKNLSNNNVEYNPVYLANVEKIHPFLPNNETLKLLWNLKDDMEQ